MYKQFRKEQPQGFIDKEEFREMMRQMGVVDSFLQDLIFNVFDEDKGEKQLPRRCNQVSFRFETC